MATGGLEDDSDFLGSVIREFGCDILGSAGLECPICLKVYKDPRALACLHTFCLECLEVLVLKAEKDGQLKNGIDCPICVTRTNIGNQDLSPEEWSIELPRNYALAAASQKKRSAMDSNPLCQPCMQNNESHDASMFCLSCSQFQCEDCVAIHKRFSSMKGHKMKTIDSYEKGDKIFYLTPLLHCHEHNDLIKYYCTDHGKLCCTTCAIIAHKRCDNVEIRNVNKDVNDKIVKRDMTHMTRNIDNVCRLITENEADVDCDISRIEARLASLRGHVLERLDKFENGIRDEMQRKKQSMKVVNDKIRDEINRLSAALEGSISMIDAVTRDSSPETKFVVMEKLKQQCLIYRTSIDELLVEAKAVHMKLEVDDSLKHFSESNDELGKVNIVSGELNALNKTKSSFWYYDDMSFLQDQETSAIENIHTKSLVC